VLKSINRAVNKLVPTVEEALKDRADRSALTVLCRCRLSGHKFYAPHAAPGRCPLCKSGLVPVGTPII
jgi:predicted Zn-ribbon and HTH transcriptional regulator